MKKHGRRTFALLTALALSLTLLPLMPADAHAIPAPPQNVDIRVDQDDLLDLVLTLGDTDTDVSALDTDLTQALVDRGVPADKIRIQAVESSEVEAGNTAIGWEIYDHTNFNDASVIPYYRPFYSETNGNYTLSNHIAVTTSGATNIDFFGYGSPPFKDFMYMPNEQYGTKTFDFTIQEGEFYDALDGAGFLFNTSMSPASNLAARTMSGYLVFFQYTWSSPPPTVIVYKFVNVNVNTFHGELSLGIQQGYPGFTPIAQFSAGPESTRAIRIVASTDSLQMVYNGIPVTWSLLSGGSATQTVPLDTDFGAYGFGPLVGYLSHGCSRHTHFTFNNVTMSTESARRFSEVIREPEWRAGSKRFVINAEDGPVADFSDPVALGEILTRLGNEGIHYLGWGRNAADGIAFVAKNDGNGTYIDKMQSATDTYAEQIGALADYVYANYLDGVVNDTDWLVYGKPTAMTVSPESEKSGTADAAWPDGKWRIDHDPDWFDNSTGTALYDNQYLDNLDISFVEIGRYDVYFKDVLIKTVYVHRAPVAGFGVTVDGSYAVSITDNAFDPDHQTESGKGIAAASWAWRESSSDTWIAGQPAQFASGKDYIIRQTVTDVDGLTGIPYYRYVSTHSNSSAKPISEFDVSPARLLTYQTETVSYADTSYDPQGGAITARIWKVYRESDLLYSDAVPKTDFSGVAAGTYKIVLSVRNANNVWSEESARYLTVVRDTTDPVIGCNVTDGSIDAPTALQVTITDENGGSGFASRQAVIDQSAGMPAAWGSIGTNPAFTLSLGQPGTWYVHVKAVDYAGNDAAVTYGPYTLTDNAAPSQPVVNASPAYTDGTWATQPVTLTATGSTDDFTAAGDLVYRMSVNGTDYADGNTLTISNSGIHTVYFKVLDETGNASAAVSRTVRVDTADPSVEGTPDLSEIRVQAKLNVTAADNIGLASVRTRIGSGAWSSVDLTGLSDPALTHTLTLTIPFTGTEAAAYVIRLETTDLAGRTSASTLSILPPSVAARILLLPDPDTGSDDDVRGSEADIRDTKRLYDMLTSAEKAGLPDGLSGRFDRLLTRMTQLLQIIPRDEDTGVEAESIGTAVQIPELNDPQASLIRIELKVEENKPGTTPNFLVVAGETLNEQDQEILQSFDISLIKTVIEEGGATRSGKVDNSDITGWITVRLPVPAAFQGRRDLQVVYIDDQGAVTALPTTLVVIDGQKYLEFQTMHFSTYAIVAAEEVALPNTGEHGTTAGWALLATIAACGAAILLKRRRNRGSQEA